MLTARTNSSIVTTVLASQFPAHAAKVGFTVTATVSVAVEGAVSVGVRVAGGVFVTVGVPLAVAVTVGVREADGPSVTLGVGVSVGVPLAVVKLRVGV